MQEASVEHGEDLRLVDGLCEVEEAVGGRSPLRAKEVQGAFRTLAGGRVVAEALVLTHPVLPARQVARHVRPHVQVDVVDAQVEGEIELLLVAEGKARVPEQLHELGEAGVVLIRIGEIN